MYIPRGFNRRRAVQLAELTAQAYAQLDAFLGKKDWTIQGGYSMIAELRYEGIRTESSKQLAFPFEGKALKKGTPIGFIARDGNEVFLVFRGTRTGSEWLKNIKIRLSPYPHAALGKVHDGFIEAYDMFRRTIIDSLNGLGRGKRLYITGHSLGAGLATLAAPDIVCATSFGLPVVYTFASPRVGDLQFADGFNRLMKGASFRIANTCDLVVSIPFPVPFLGFIGGYFTHVETPVDFTTQREDLDKNHAIDTYLSAMREAGKGEGMFRSLFRRRARGSAAPAASR